MPFSFEHHLFSRGGKDEADKKVGGQGYGPGYYMLPAYVGNVMGFGAGASGPMCRGGSRRHRSHRGQR